MFRLINPVDICREISLSRTVHRSCRAFHLNPVLFPIPGTTNQGPNFFIYRRLKVETQHTRSWTFCEPSETHPPQHIPHAHCWLTKRLAAGHLLVSLP